MIKLKDLILKENYIDNDWNVGQKYSDWDVLVYVQNMQHEFADDHRVSGYFNCLMMNPRDIPESPYEINDEHVAELAATREPFPPIVLDKHLDIIDGGHRLAAAVRRGDREIKVLKQI
jgi:hypothetical protein